MMDSDMIVRRNMDELFDLRLDDDMIAAVHACTCNPMKLAHYPEDWYVHMTWDGNGSTG
jgi:alpha-N-acetylglucosamine transferase